MVRGGELAARDARCAEGIFLKVLNVYGAVPVATLFKTRTKKYFRRCWQCGQALFVPRGSYSMLLVHSMLLVRLLDT